VIEHIEGDDPHQFSLQVGNQYGIGSKEDNRGLILTLATLDRSYCLMPGHGLEGDLPDIICYRIDNHVLVPRLKESAWDKAVDETVDAVSALLLKDTLTVERLLPSSPSRNNQVEDPTFFEVVLGAIIGIPLILIMIWVLCRMLFFIPNLICNMIIPYKEVEWNPGRFMRMFMHCFNWFWNIRISLYYTDKLGRKILYVDNSDTEFISYSGGSGSSSYSSGYSSYSSSSHSHYHSSGRSHGSRGGGSFGGGGHSGRF